MIFNTILTIVGMACLTNLAHKAPLYHTFLVKNNIDRKPFNCVMCSTFWYTFGFTLLSNPAESIFIAATAAILAEIINIQIHKL